MHKILLENAFNHIQPSAGFESRTLERLRRADEPHIRKGRRLCITGGLTAFACIALVCALILIPWRGPVADDPAGLGDPAETSSACLQLDGHPVAYEELKLPPEDGLDFSDETFGAEMYPIVCKVSPDHTQSLGSASLAIIGTVQRVWYNHYSYDEAAVLRNPEQRLQYQADTIAYEIRVEKIFGAREEAASVQVGDVIQTENHLFGMDDMAMIEADQRMQQGHRYILMLSKGSGLLVSEKGTAAMESPYYVEGDLEAFPMIEMTEDGGYLFHALGWEKLRTADAVPVIMPEDTHEAQLYLRAGPGFEEDFQRLVDQKLLMKE